MPNSSVEDRFAVARNRAAKAQIVVIGKDSQQVVLPALSKESVRPEMLEGAERIMPSTIKRQVAVIADTSWVSEDTLTIQHANQAIPFFGILMGLSCIGHSVWVFEGTGATLCAGCREADVLLVDSASIAALPPNWQVEVKRVMRNPQIVIHDRSTYKLRTEP
jgi:hypothetical protein